MCTGNLRRDLQAKMLSSQKTMGMSSIQLYIVLMKISHTQTISTQDSKNLCLEAFKRI